VEQVAIVIFGAAVRADGQPSNTLRRRVEAAATFGARQVEPLYVPTGAVGRYGPSEASIMAELLGAFGVPPDRIVVEETGRDTLSSARACARLLRARGHGGRVYAATSAYHLPRCVMLLRLAGLRAHACPPPAFPAAARLRARWFWRLRELAALPVDAAFALALRITGRL
jgi:uncharacterized SAM-binding protein YcdF (DUF218 family)